jgi:hypothetical protein
MNDNAIKITIVIYLLGASLLLTNGFLVLYECASSQFFFCVLCLSLTFFQQQNTKNTTQHILWLGKERVT